MKIRVREIDISQAHDSLLLNQVDSRLVDRMIDQPGELLVKGQVSYCGNGTCTAYVPRPLLIDTGAKCTVCKVGLIPRDKLVEAPRPKCFVGAGDARLSGGTHGAVCYFQVPVLNRSGKTSLRTFSTFVYEVGITNDFIISYPDLAEHMLAVVPTLNALVPLQAIWPQVAWTTQRVREVSTFGCGSAPPGKGKASFRECTCDIYNVQNPPTPSAERCSCSPSSMRAEEVHSESSVSLQAVETDQPCNNNKNKNKNTSVEDTQCTGNEFVESISKIYASEPIVATPFPPLLL